MFYLFLMRIYQSDMGSVVLCFSGGLNTLSEKKSMFDNRCIQPEDNLYVALYRDANLYKTEHLGVLMDPSTVYNRFCLAQLEQYIGLCLFLCLFINMRQKCNNDRLRDVEQFTY